MSRKESEGKLAQLRAVMVEASLVCIEVCFDGQGDSGCIEEIVGYGAFSDGVRQPDANSCRELTEELRRMAEDVAWLYLGWRSPGWEINSGSSGHVWIFYDKGVSLSIDHRIESTEHHHYEDSM